MWSEMQLNYGWIDVLRETFVSQSVSQWFSKWGKGNLWRSFLQCYRSVEILCSQTEKTVVYVKERAQFEAKDEKLLLKYVRNTCTTCKLSYSLFVNIIFPWFTTFKETAALVLNKRHEPWAITVLSYVGANS